VNAGKACLEYHDKTVQKIKAKRVQCDEIWSFVYCKKKNLKDGMYEVAGDVWTWIGIDADSKLVISFFSGHRDATGANGFMQDLYSRLNNRVQLTTDGYKPYIDVVGEYFGNEVDFARLEKQYDGSGRYK